MSNNVNKRKISIIDSGFSAKAEKEGKRLLNKDGTFNVRKIGLSFMERFSVYHWLLGMSWLRFFGVLFSGYIIVNLLFASAYYLGGIEGLSGRHDNDALGQFLEAFYFSTQTLTTVGYGFYSPISEFHSLLASFESFIGLMSFAMATGLLYGKFSKPKTRFVFSENALISPYKNGERGLMIRLANAKENQLTNVKATMMLSWIDPNSDGLKRKYYLLDMEIDSIYMMATSWTLVHPMDENSPLYNLSEAELGQREAEVIVQLEGFDETYSQVVHSRTSYKSKEMVWGAKFVSILGHDGDSATLNMDEIGSYTQVDLN